MSFKGQTVMLTGAALTSALTRFGRVDVLCNLAGGFRMGQAVHETLESSWDFLLDINARTLLTMTRVVVPHLLARGGGKIGNVNCVLPTIIDTPENRAALPVTGLS